MTVYRLSAVQQSGISLTVVYSTAEVGLTEPTQALQTLAEWTRTTLNTEMLSTASKDRAQGDTAPTDAQVHMLQEATTPVISAVRLSVQIAAAK